MAEGERTTQWNLATVWFCSPEMKEREQVNHGVIFPRQHHNNSNNLKFLMFPCLSGPGGCPEELNSVTESPKRTKQGREGVGDGEPGVFPASSRATTLSRNCCSDLHKYPGVRSRNVRINILWAGIWVSLWIWPIRLSLCQQFQLQGELGHRGTEHPGIHTLPAHRPASISQGHQIFHTQDTERAHPSHQPPPSTWM